VARVTLQEYDAEARRLIEERAFDQAIGICRHILQRYPKHTRTYQILGEALLEKGELGEAESIFSRLLEQADPENFVAYGGLGVIKEEKGQFDQAIWYMERTFELVPNRDEVRNALRRLYGKRDGTEPTRIKLNKAALARLYSRGGQYRQAIEELRTLLQEEENSDRIDLKLSLAETLWCDRRLEQAAELLREILQSCPNCLKAILLLGEIHIEKGQTNEAKALFDRTRSLDPENITAQALFGEQSPLPTKVIKIPRMVQTAEEILSKVSKAETPPEEQAISPQAAPLEAAGEKEMPVEAVPEEEPTGEMMPETEATTARPAEPEEAVTEAEPEEPLAPTESQEIEAVAEEAVEADTTADQAPPVETTPEEQALPAEAVEPAIPAVGEATPEDVTLASAAETAAASLPDVEHLKLRLEQRPKDNESRLLLARAYRDREQMKLALEQYGKLLRSKSTILSEAVDDVETIVASRPDNLEAHELLADLYTKNGQLQEAVDRYRWILRRLDSETE
jgi:tetratricopeptide (TPR) repeat protein